MTASALVLYSKNKDRLSQNDLVGQVVKLALVTSTYAPDATSTGNSLWADVSANEIVAGNGYTAGGLALTALASAATTGNTGFKFSSAAAVWTASGTGIPAHRYVVMYVLGTLWGRVNPVIGYYIGDNTPADIPVTTAGNTLTETPSASGWFDLT